MTTNFLDGVLYSCDEPIRSRFGFLFDKVITKLRKNVFPGGRPNRKVHFFARLLLAFRWLVNI